MPTPIDSAAVAASALGDGPHLHVIGGQWLPAANGARFAIDNPASGDLLAEVPDGGAEDAVAAVDAAATALAGWAATPAPQRAIVLRRVATLMLEQQERLATIMTLEQGKPLAEARGEIAYAASFFS
ncbi:MAG: aldehyde dehydrogenase family protein, partial [Oscillochloris sp.]|nr:aldehyde dehydrogenase family protein [Oscillochloris sp.]